MKIVYSLILQCMRGVFIFIVLNIYRVKKILIITAGGSGKRMGTGLPKQFLTLNDKPILWHSAERFLHLYPDIRIIIAIHKEYKEHCLALISTMTQSKNILVIEGGKERYHTVKAALQHVDEDAIVAIHDAVRPLVSYRTIKKAFESCSQHQSAIPIVAANDSIRIYTNNTYQVFDRNKVFSIQTPQCFHAKPLKKAYQQKYDKPFTDDATVWEAAGHELYFFEGNRENIKITYPHELIFAEQLLHNIREE